MPSWVASLDAKFYKSKLWRQEHVIDLVKHVFIFVACIRTNHPAHWHFEENGNFLAVHSHLKSLHTTLDNFRAKATTA